MNEHKKEMHPHKKNRNKNKNVYSKLQLTHTMRTENGKGNKIMIIIISRLISQDKARMESVRNTNVIHTSLFPLIQPILYLLTCEM